MRANSKKPLDTKPNSALSKGVTAQKKSNDNAPFQFLQQNAVVNDQENLQRLANDSSKMDQAFQLQALADKRSSHLTSTLQLKETTETTRTKNTTGLPDRLKSGIETLSGYSMNDVKVHYNSSKPAQLSAHAYAQGTEIHVAPQQEKHLPHEAWHVVQQKQGRVKPTMQLMGKFNINDDKALEKEADTMGMNALNVSPTTPGPLKESTNYNKNYLQPVWIIRNGETVWENNPYVLQDGEQLFNAPFTQSPSVIHDSGKKIKKIDRSGKSRFEKFGKKPPTHPKLQKIRKNQGKIIATRALKRRKLLPDDINQLRDIATKLEKIAGDAVPLTHKTKISGLYKRGLNKGTQFRGVHPNQDELTQSESSTSFIQGYTSKSISSSSSFTQLLNEYGELLLRAMSSLRAPTSAILAPIEDESSNITGQQHPTNDEQEVLTGGSSSHAYSDRARVQGQNEVVDELLEDEDAPPNAVFLSSLLVAGIKTLSTMSFPLSAKNVPDFNIKHKKEQYEARERIKKQVNLLAEELGIPIAKGFQDYDADFTSHDTPTSPRRMNEEETELLKKKTTSDPNELLHYQATYQSLLEVLNELFASSDFFANPLPEHTDLLIIYNTLNNLDYNDAAGSDALNALFQYTYNWFVNLKDIVIRRQVGGGSPANDELGATGHRFPAMRQFFAECGQMAAHNALLLVQGLNWQNADNYLNALGNFENMSDENDIRNMLALAGQNNIPVIGSIAQMQGLMNLLNNDDYMGLFNAGIHMFGNEINGINAANQFSIGATNHLNLIVNTAGHSDKKSGYHWINVLLIRQQDGQIGVQYRDSLESDVDYSVLFASLRNVFGHVAPQDQDDEENDLLF